MFFSTYNNKTYNNRFLIKRYTVSDTDKNVLLLLNVALIYLRGTKQVLRQDGDHMLNGKISL